MTRKKCEGIFLDQKLKIARRSKQKKGGWELRGLTGFINGLATHT
jgi:hypothetical protein